MQNKGFSGSKGVFVNCKLINIFTASQASFSTAVHLKLSDLTMLNNGIAILRSCGRVFSKYEMEAKREMHSACERGGRIFIKLFFLCSGILLAEFIKECPRNWNLCDITTVLFRANFSPILTEQNRMNSTNNL